MKQTPRTTLAAQVFASRMADIDFSPKLEEGETAADVKRAMKVEIEKEVRRAWLLSGDFGRVMSKIQEYEAKTKKESMNDDS